MLLPLTELEENVLTFLVAVADPDLKDLIGDVIWLVFPCE